MLHEELLNPVLGQGSDDLHKKTLLNSVLLKISPCPFHLTMNWNVNGLLDELLLEL